MPLLLRIIGVAMSYSFLFACCLLTANCSFARLLLVCLPLADLPASCSFVLSDGMDFHGHLPDLMALFCQASCMAVAGECPEGHLANLESLLFRALGIAVAKECPESHLANLESLFFQVSDTLAAKNRPQALHLLPARLESIAAFRGLDGFG